MPATTFGCGRKVGYGPQPPRTRPEGCSFHKSRLTPRTIQHRLNFIGKRWATRGDHLATGSEVSSWPSVLRLSLSHRRETWLSVRFADDRKLQTRGNYGISNRPQICHNTQLDARLDMTGEQVSHGRNCQGRHIATCHPITSFGNLRLEKRPIELISKQPTRPNPLQPSAFYCVQSTRSPQSQQTSTGLSDRCCLANPATGAGTIAWKPVARSVLFVQRPDQRFNLARSQREMRPEQLDRWVLRKMKEGVHECILQVSETKLI